ncbi:MAG: type II toxin-antitoxin system VapC family toxin [Candidatus Sericytochromatia bacterium]|nr:type II toxin-antitoxin system VapC family toxin [Candidatus Tanganyikabacteria bacterium]
MRLLLDAHSLLWWAFDPGRLSGRAREAIEVPTNEVFASAAAIWELFLKASHGKLRLPADLESRIRADGISLLPIHFSHARRVSELPWLHRDPFDRMLVAQAQVEALTLVTRDDAIRKYDVPTLLA